MSAVDRLQELPSGTITFLFTDMEGSTRLLRELGPVGYASALAEHRRILREAFGAHGGVEVDTQGDAFFVAFPTAPGAVATARAITEGLRAGPISVRIGLHTGAPLLTDEGYVGSDVHRAARIAAAGHGGQVLVSASTVALVGTDGLRDLGEHRLKDLSAPERIYQLGADVFPPLKSLNASNLPVAASPLVGRKRELADVKALLRDSARLVTLTGAGGSGKTRLGLQAVAELGLELDRLEREHDNLRAALDTFAHAGETERTVRLTAALSGFWFVRGHSGDARKRLPAALQTDTRPSVARATVLRSVAVLALDEGDPERAERLATRAIAMSRDIEDRRGEGRGQILLAQSFADRGDLERARSLAAESARAINRALGYSFEIAFDLDYLAAAAVAEGSPQLAARLLGRAEALRTEIGARIRGADSVVNDETLRAIRSELDAEALAAAWEAGGALDLDEAVALGLGDTTTSRETESS